jgi:hypothetical protein
VVGGQRAVALTPSERAALRWQRQRQRLAPRSPWPESEVHQARAPIRNLASLY